MFTNTLADVASESGCPGLGFGKLAGCRFVDLKSRERFEFSSHIG